MPSQGEHLGWGERSGGLLALLATSEHSDWAIVVTAYRALHLVEAVFATRGVHHLSHLARNRAVRAEFPEIALPYMRLQNLSRIARYDVDGVLGPAELISALEEFAAIEAGLRPLLERP